MCDFLMTESEHGQPVGIRGDGSDSPLVLRTWRDVLDVAQGCLHVGVYGEDVRRPHPGNLDDD